MKRFAKLITNRNMVFRGLLMAYAVLRINSSYAQVLPDQIPNLTAWLSADTLVTYDAGFLVSLWDDRSANANDASQGNTAFQPTFIPSEVRLNGKPSIHFNSANFTRLRFALSVIPLDSFTVFIVCRQDVFGDQAILSTLTGGNGLLFRYKDTASPAQMRFFSGGTPYDNNLTDLQHSNFTIYSFINQASAAASGNMFLNINQQSQPAVSLTLSPAHDDSLNIGALPGGGIPLDGNIAELIIYSRELTALEVSDVEMYLRNKYAPPVNLGANICAITPDSITLDAGARFVSFLWSTADTTQTITVDTSGTYIVTVTDVFGFTSTDSITVNYLSFNEPPLNTMICFGDSLEWNTNLSTLDYSFLWSTGASTPSIYLNSTAQYWVTATHLISGCAKTSDTVNVIIDNYADSISLGPAVASLCQGNILQLVSGAGQAQTYLWSDSSTAATLTVQVTDTYWVSVTDTNGCVAGDTAVITIVGVAPTADFISPSVCDNDSMYFTDTSFSNDTSQIISWDWVFGDPASGANDTATGSTPVHLFSASGTYQVTLVVSTSSGCSKDTTIDVIVKPGPVPLFTHPPPCSGMPLQFNNTTDTVGVTSWQWNFGDPGSGGNNVSSLKNPSHTFNTSGNFSVTLTVTLSNGCSAADTVIVTVNQGVNPVFTFSNTCIGQVTSFSTSVSASLLWNFGDNSFSTQQNPLHQYAFVQTYQCTLTATTQANCMSSFTLPVTIHDLPVAHFSTPPACLNVPYQMLDSSYVPQGTINQWLWRFPDFTTDTMQNPYYTFNDTLQYNITLAVTSNYGCSDTVTRPVKVYPLPTASFTSDVTYGDAPLDVDFSNLSAGAASYFWNFGDTAGTSALANPSYTYTSLGTYPVTLVASTAFGCTDTMVRYIFVLEPVLDLAVTGINKTSGTNTISLSAGIANLGNVAATGFKISAWLENSLPVFENWNGNLLPQTTLQPPYSFAASFEIPQINPPNILCVEITEVNGQQDDNPDNNIRCINMDEDFVVVEPYPNPSEQVINLQVVISRKDFLSITVYDASGKLIREVFNGLASAGLNKFIFDISSLSEGTYFCKYTYSAKTVVKPLTHISKKKK